MLPVSYPKVCGRWVVCKTSSVLSFDQAEQLTQWKITSMDNLCGKLPQWKTTFVEGNHYTYSISIQSLTNA